MKMRWISMLFLCVILLSACNNSIHPKAAPAANMGEDASIDEISPESVTPPKPIEIRITAVGDVMVHGPQLKAQYDSISGQFDFHNNFQFIKPYIESADLALLNLETTFGGEEKGYSSFPRFNSPDSLAEALKTAGFDVAVTGNNHTIDTGMDGVVRTLEVLQAQGFKTIGTRKSVEESRFLIEDVQGIKVGITAYTYETPAYGKNKTINALIMPSLLEPLINSFRFDRWKEDLSQIKSTIDAMRVAGAEIIVFYLHWGEEFQRSPNQSQKQIAQDLNAHGVDVIFGSHPHVLQPIEWIKHPDHDHQTLVVYSLGNFLSNQRYEILKNRYTEDGMLVHIKIQKDLVTNGTTISHVGYQPTWVHKYVRGDKRIFEILPLPQALQNPQVFHLSSSDAQHRAKLSYHNTTSLLQQELPGSMPFSGPKRKVHKNDIE
ncbi:CapA family protein [Anaerosolibacter sp.]|uniref:CapA family protein n=1 Tax=Anaerosolibacter sp. TaxID=1872527 RepID=UPI0039EFB6A9